MKLEKKLNIKMRQHEKKTNIKMRQHEKMIKKSLVNSNSTYFQIFNEFNLPNVISMYDADVWSTI